MSRSIVLFCFFLFSILIASSTAVDFITANQTISDGASTIESAGGVFELGFFCPGRSKNRYLGIWYKKISTGTVVWVANRETPLTDTSGVLRIDSMGTLVLTNGTDSIIWSSSSNSSISVTNPVVQLLDTGNLVIRDESDGYSKNYLWQSFDHPGDTLLPGMKEGWDLVKGLDNYITSWKSSYDPSPGNYTSRIDPNGYPQLLLRKGSAVQFRFGPWDGIQFSGMYHYLSKQIYTDNFVYNQKEIYYKYELINNSTFMRILLDPNGNIQLLTWINRTQSWESYHQIAQRDDCDHYAFCGAYSICNGVNSQLLKADACGCLKGFEPKFSEKKKSADWGNGCVRKTQLNCKSGEWFLRYSGLKLPDTRHSWFDPNMNIEECESLCLNNCSCTAYAIMHFKGGRNGCMLWFNDLIDIRDYSEDVKDLYVRMAASEFEANRSSRSKTKARTIVVTVLIALAVLTGLILVHIFQKRKLKRKLRRKGISLVNLESDDANQSETEDLLQLPLFDFRTIAHATNFFSQTNKLGEGGFGPVYKGILDEGQEIAVKRLSKTSKQGQDEFKNEVSCISKLQHRNLVRLLGCCIEDGEMLLIYEYMPNKSLDSFIFDNKLGELLDWSKRYNIINGIARGLLYLHQDSRLRIIHRDLKASNILLDCEMNPRISDFGIARSFKGSETEVNTSRVVGTYGYMSPEYALDGIFSFKSDVYSFGVLVLEIVSGTKMRRFYNSDPGLNLLGHAWSLYEDGKFSELIDARISESCNQFEAFRAIEIGLLCVQSHPNDRPSMSSVVSMLSSDTVLPRPKQPGFFIDMKQHESGSSSSKSESCLSNNLTVTVLAPR